MIPWGRNHWKGRKKGRSQGRAGPVACNENESYDRWNQADIENHINESALV